MLSKQKLPLTRHTVSSDAEKDFTDVAFRKEAARAEAAAADARRLLAADGRPPDLSKLNREQLVGWVRERERRSRSSWGPVLFRAYRFRPLRPLIIHTLERLEGGRFFSKTLRDIFRHYYAIELGNYSWGRTIQNIWLPPGTRIGHYSNFIANVYRRNHTFDRVSQHPFFYNAKLGLLPKDNIQGDDQNPLTVGNDVHTGFRVLVTSRCTTVGNGAYLEAGSLVTKDVEPYSIVMGNPGKVIGQRFSDEVIAEIEASQWWLQPLSRLIEEPEFFLNPASADLIQRLNSSPRAA